MWAGLITDMECTMPEKYLVFLVCSLTKQCSFVYNPICLHIHLLNIFLVLSLKTTMQLATAVNANIT